MGNNSCIIESAEKLESLNQGYVGRITALMENVDNNNKWGLNNQGVGGNNRLNLTLSDKMGQVNIGGKVEGQVNNSLRKIHNDIRHHKQVWCPSLSKP